MPLGSILAILFFIIYRAEKKKTKRQSTQPPKLVVNVESKPVQAITNCPNCGAPISASNVFCEFCGTKLPKTAEEGHTVHYYDEAEVEKIKLEHERELKKIEFEHKLEEKEFELKKLNKIWKIVVIIAAIILIRIMASPR